MTDDDRKWMEKLDERARDIELVETAMADVKAQMPETLSRYVDEIRVTEATGVDGFLMITILAKSPLAHQFWRERQRKLQHSLQEAMHKSLVWVFLHESRDCWKCLERCD